jgi:cell division protein FtsA
LETTVGGTIAKVYIGIGGQSFHSEKNIICRDLEDNTSITEEIVDSIGDENRDLHLSNLTILDVIPQEYHINSMRLLDPIGNLGNHIEGHFVNIVARSIIIKNIRQCFKQADIEIFEDPFINPLITADYVLSDNERRAGCVLVDFGADVTSVAIYRKQLLRFFSVIPLGSSNITRDLMSLNIEEDEAEELKIQYGNALFEELKDGEEDKMIVLRDEENKVPISKINDIVQARTEEIILNVYEQIKSSGYDAVLGAGVIFTGGGSNLRNLKEAFLKLSKQHYKIRIAHNVYNQTIMGVVIPDDGSQNALLGMLLKGKQNCCKKEIVIPPVTPIIKEPVEIVETPVSSEPIETSFTTDDVIFNHTYPIDREEEEKKAAEERKRQEEEAAKRQKAREEEQRKKEEERKKKEEERKRKEEEKEKERAQEKQRKQEEKKNRRENRFLKTLKELSQTIFTDEEMDGKNDKDDKDDKDKNEQL